MQSRRNGYPDGMTGLLSLRGAHEHNLRHVDLDLPLGRWTSVVGPSGSGKTSLVVDTIVREGQGRFLSGLSARARQFHGKLGRAAVEGIRGLPATLVVGQQTATDSPRSTVGTLSGALDLLRLLFAREGVDPEGVALTRSHFSFNHPLGACKACGGLGLEDRVAPAKIVADASRSIRAGALKPTLKNGYTVYSQVTLEVMDLICRAHGFDVDTPWRELTDEQRDVILYGTKQLKVPFGKHSIESRMRWEGITARPREEGYYRGLVPVIQETLERNRNPNILRFVETAACGACGGARLGRPGREARVGEARLPELLALPVRALWGRLADLPPSPVWEAVRPEVELRLERMERLGLAHLALERTSGTLSGGESQRLRLVAQLTAGLGRQLVAFDEPTLGLHPSGQAGMRAVLDELLELGNTLVVVEHDKCRSTPLGPAWERLRGQEMNGCPRVGRAFRRRRLAVRGLDISPESRKRPAAPLRRQDPRGLHATHPARAPLRADPLPAHPPPDLPRGPRPRLELAGRGGPEPSTAQAGRLPGPRERRPRGPRPALPLGGAHEAHLRLRAPETRECGARREVIACITEREVARTILRHLGLPDEPPSSTPARAPPLLDFARRPPGDAGGHRQS